MRTSQSTNSNKRLFLKYMQEKLAVTVIVITLALFSLIFVLYRIIKNNQENYNQIVLSQQEYDSRVIPYRRGDIVDRNGTYLATSEKVYNLIIDPKQIMSDEENFLEATVSALSSVFGYDAGEIRAMIQEKKDTAYVRYARQLTYDQKDAFETLEKDTNKANRKADSKARIKGVWFEDEYKRQYPYNSLACNIIGFATSDGGTGTGGIEQFYNSTLIGNNGREYGYLNDESNLERVIKPAANGNTIVSTIDVNIQNIVEKHINQWMEEMGSKTIGVVVMDPNNGEVLAMGTNRQFDLNNPRDVTKYYPDASVITEFGVKEACDTYKRTNGVPLAPGDVYQHYTADEVQSLGQQVAWNQIWRNYCISDTYEPGSPSKIFTVAAGLEEGLINENSTFFCDGYQDVGGWMIKCTAFKKGGHGMQALDETLMNSCNDAMMQIAALEGKDTFSKYMQMFGFGNKTGIDLPGEADTKGLVYDATNMSASDLATNSFGQNYNCTMIQMAAAYCSVINGGSYYEPHVVKQILNEQGSVVKKVEPNLVRETVSESTAQFIRKALYRTVAEGTGKGAQVVGYEVAGKTGTAEKYPRKHGNYLVSFSGFAPYDNPEVLVYVAIDEPHTDDQAHSTFASNQFAAIMQDILPYMNVFPTLDIPETDASAEGQLPAEEGITDNTGSETGTSAEGETSAEEETAAPVYDTEEYVAPEGGDSEELPGEPAGADEESSAGPTGGSLLGDTGSAPPGAAQNGPQGPDGPGSGPATVPKGPQSTEAESTSQGEVGPAGTTSAETTAAP